MNELDLNALIGSRICHDLISPIGAIGNGVELLNMSGMAVGPEMALITESVENANARIRFFRVAFGAAAKGAILGRSETVSILAGMYRSGRMKVIWSIDGDQHRRLVKLGFLALMCVESALVWGGEVAFSEKDGRWSLTARGEKIKIDDALWSMAASGPTVDDMPASDVHFALAPIAALTAGRSISVDVTDGEMVVSF